ncbi:hypothetical protein MA092_004552 [Salmonella enterica]|nr:hypothetical protein [Salmonella enterica]
MKKILAIATLTAASFGSAHAAITPANSSAVTDHPVQSTYTFDYTATTPSVAPQYVTSVKRLDATNAPNNTILADTVFTTDQESTDYHVEATYNGDNSNSYAAAFSSDGSTGTVGNTYATVGHGEVAHIVLIKNGEVAAGTTTVTYNVTGYHS